MPAKKASLMSLVDGVSYNHLLERLMMLRQDRHGERGQKVNREPNGSVIVLAKSGSTDAWDARRFIQQPTCGLLLLFDKAGIAKIRRTMPSFGDVTGYPMPRRQIL